MSKGTKVDGEAQATRVQQEDRESGEVPFPAFISLGSPRAGENSAPDASFLGVSLMSSGERFSL